MNIHNIVESIIKFKLPGFHQYEWTTEVTSPTEAGNIGRQLINLPNDPEERVVHIHKYADQFHKQFVAPTFPDHERKPLLKPNEDAEGWQEHEWSLEHYEHPEKEHFMIQHFFKPMPKAANEY